MVIAGYDVLLDEEDIIAIDKLKWHVNKSDLAKGYIYFRHTINNPIKGEPHSLLLHRYILGIYDPSIVVDHINGDTCDNRRCNLRPCSRWQNNLNKKIHIKNISGYPGVSWDCKNRKWKAEIQFGYKKYFLGRYEDKEIAAQKYKDAALELYGQYARIN